MSPSRRGSPPARARESVARHLEQVKRSLRELEAAVDLASYGSRRESARNLLHYLAFRRFDLRRDQSWLARRALSSLGRSEGHVLFTLSSVLAWLKGGPREDFPQPPPREGITPERGRQILDQNARTVFGSIHRGRKARIMVTMPAEAANDYGLVRRLLAAGMDCARINCAHDSAREWARMIRHIHRAERALRRSCWIEMDLSGPKIRTGPMAPGPAVIRLRPTRDVCGRVVSPAPVWLVARRAARRVAPRPDAITVGAGWLARRHPKEKVSLTDARGSRRTLRLLRRDRLGFRAEVEQTTYVADGIRLSVRTGPGRSDRTSVGPLPHVVQRIRLGVGDRLMLTAEGIPGEEARRDPRGRVTRPGHIACTLPRAFRFVRPGQSIWFDDGRIGAVVRSARRDRLAVKVTHAPARGAWLGADKGINLPETRLELSPVTSRDRRDLRFVVRHANVVGYSFVHRPSDVAVLRRELGRLGRPHMGIVLKVETRRAFESLPRLLLAALRQPPAGVMIARGDLAVEVGFERLAEVQEEILWLCEAAHLPTIWATDVLEGLTKLGRPSRAEVTDAAMGERAECVMLNKGPHVAEAVEALHSILLRMQSHQSKKMSMLRHLQVVERFIGPSTDPST